MTAKEDHPLLKPINSGTNPFNDLDFSENDSIGGRNAAYLYRNFITMALSFSINHGNLYRKKSTMC